MTNDLKKGVFSSILLLVKTLSDKLIGLISTLILARILVPEDFGIIAIATLFMGLMNVLSETGASSYLLKEEFVDDSKINTAWSINVLLKSVLSLVIIFCSPVIAALYDDQRVLYVVISMAVLFSVSSLKNPGLFHLSRKQKYGAQVRLEIIAKVLSVTTAVVTAFVYKNYWALVAGQTVNHISIVIGSYFISQYRPAIEFKNAKAQLRFSGWMLPQALVGYLRTQLDTFIVSSSFGKSALGSYHTMKYIAFIPSSHILLPLTWPFLVEIRSAMGDTDLFNKRVTSSATMLLLLSIPMSVFLYSYSEPLTNILLGEKWLDYHYILGTFGAMIPAFITTNEANRLLVIFGKTRNLFFAETLRSISVYAILFAIGFSNIEEFITNFVTFETIAASIYFFYVMTKYTGIRYSSKLLFSTVLITAISFLAMFGALGFMPDFQLSVLFQTLLSGTLFLLTYGILLIYLYVIIFNRFTEWHYLQGLLYRSVLPVLNKLKRH